MASICPAWNTKSSSRTVIVLDPLTAIDPISGERPRKLHYGLEGAWRESKSTRYMPCYDPSTSALISLAPQCTAKEMEECIQLT